MPAAEYVRVLDGDSVLFSIPQGIEHELDYLTCADIFATAWTSITQTGFQPGDSVAVYGAGPVGLLAAYSALFRGAVTVYSIDHVEARLARAESIGAIPIDLRKGDPSAQILKLQPNGVQRVSDCVGFECVNPQLKPQEGFVVNDAIKVVASGGGIAVTGVYYSGPPDKGEPLQGPQFATIPFDIAAWWFKGATINGGLVAASDAEPTLKDLVTAGRVRPGFVFDHICHIDEAPEAYRLFNEHKIQKAAIKFEHWP
jgi:threonine dehydrogenase-like Zn-dependent dehydrogenase